MLALAKKHSYLGKRESIHLCLLKKNNKKISGLQSIKPLPLISSSAGGWELPGDFILEKSFEVCVHSSLLTFTDTVWHWHSLNMSDKSHVSVSVKQVSAIWIGSGLRMPQILLHLCRGKKDTIDAVPPPPFICASRGEDRGKALWEISYTLKGISAGLTDETSTAAISPQPYQQNQPETSSSFY